MFRRRVRARPSRILNGRGLSSLAKGGLLTRGRGPLRQLLAFMSALSAVAIIACAVAAIFMPQVDLGIVKLAAIGTYVVAGLPDLRRPAQLFALLALMLVVLLGAESAFWPAVATANFLMALFLALSLVAQVAVRSPDMINVARSILALPTSRIYLPLSLTSHLFAIVLNVGSLAVLMALVGSQADQLAKRGQLRPVSMSVMRGFASMPIWAPFSISVALTLSIFRNVHYLDLLPFGLSMALFHIIAGWALDGRGTQDGLAKAAVGLEFGPILRLLFRISAMAAAAFLCEWLFAIRFVEGVFLSALTTAFVWWLSQRWSWVPDGGRGVAGPSFKRGGNDEVVIVGTAGFIGGLLSASLVSVLGGLGVLSAGAVSLLIAGVPLIMLGLGHVGLNPIISGSILGGLLLPLTLPQDHVFAAVALLAGWGVTTSGSPFTGNVLLASRLIGRTSFELAVRWNGAFCVANAAVFSVLLMLWQALTRVN
jgi:hypothetical protein